MPARRALVMHPLDNVATAIEEIGPDEEVAARIGAESLVLRAVEAVPFGFKVALEDIATGKVIRKYGEPIGRASADISKGAMVHVHNLDGIRARGDLGGAKG